MRKDTVRLVALGVALCAVGTLAGAIGACGEGPARSVDDISRRKLITKLSDGELALFCEWLTETNTIALGYPFVHLVDPEECAALERPDCALGLFLDCTETRDASSPSCRDFRDCTAEAYAPDNCGPCSSNPTECLEGGQLAECYHYRFTSGAWVVTPGEPVRICDWDPGSRCTRDYPCLCEIKNAPLLSCDINGMYYSERRVEGACVWHPRPWDGFAR